MTQQQRAILQQGIERNMGYLLAECAKASLDRGDALEAENTRLKQERDEARRLVETAIEALDHIDCGDAQCRDGYGGCDRRCALHARAAIEHLRTQSTPVAAERTEDNG
jgi:hypothetical protein